MSAHRTIVIALLLVSILLVSCKPAPPPDSSGGLAMLARKADGYEQARRGQTLRFPADHGAHPGFRLEWWYLTANLRDANGAPYGMQWTLFRLASRPGEKASQNPWQDAQVYMAHFALSSADGHVAHQRYARGGDFGLAPDAIAQAGVTAEPFCAWLDDWRLCSTGPDWLPLDVHARQGGSSVHLTLASDLPPLLQGDRGFSQKHPDGTGSHYYSQPFLTATGEIERDGRIVEVSGQAWLDREWSSQYLQPDQAGWDWFALHLESGEKLMLFQMRPSVDDATREPAGEPYRHGVLISPSGTAQVLDPAGLEFEVVELTRVAGRKLPLHWRIELAGIDLPGIDLHAVDRRFEVVALHPDQWMPLDFPYWEGVVQVSGADPGSRGFGYLELTGYPPEN